MAFNTLANYLNTVIYEIKCKDENITEVYIGHTTNFDQRYRLHKCSCNNENQKGYNYKIYQTIRANGGWDHWEMVGIENYPCDNVNEARDRERYWIELLSSSLNIVIPNRSKKEYGKIYRIVHKEEIAEKAKVYRKINIDKIKKYIQNHLEKIKDQKKEWYENHKEVILEKAKERYEENKDEKLKYQKEYAEKHQEKIKEYLKEYNEKNKEQLSANKKIYREAHKEEASQAHKNWCEFHKDELKEKRGQVMLCECGSEYTFGNQHRHLISKKHVAYQHQLCGIIVEEKDEIQEKEKEKEQQKIYREKNADKIKEYKKKYNESHKNLIKEQCKNYYEENKEKCLEKLNKYKEENKEKIKKDKEEWYQRNKEKILAKQKEVFLCDCGSSVRCSGRAEHYRSVKHKQHLTKN